MERDIKEYEKMITYMAWRYLPSFERYKTIDDLISDGYEVFVELCKKEKVNPLTCPFHTALSIQLKQKWLNELTVMKTQKRGKGYSFTSLENIIEKEHKFDLWMQDENFYDKRQRRYSKIEFLYDNQINVDKYLDLTKEMKVLVHLLWDTPTELIELSRSFSITDSIDKYLKKFQRWKPQQIKRLKQQLTPILRQI